MTDPSAMRNIHIADEQERHWGAALLAGSEPWLTLGVSLQSCRQHCQDPAYEVYLATCQGQPAGLLIWQLQGLAGSPYIKSLVVDQGFRGQGIGAALLEFGEALAKKNANHQFLCVSSFNTRAIHFYKRHGYAQVGEFPDYLIKGASELLLCKRLS